MLCCTPCTGMKYLIPEQESALCLESLLFRGLRSTVGVSRGRSEFLPAHVHVTCQTRNTHACLLQSFSRYPRSTRSTGPCPRQLLQCPWLRLRQPRHPKSRPRRLQRLGKPFLSEEENVSDPPWTDGTAFNHPPTATLSRPRRPRLCEILVRGVQGAVCQAHDEVCRRLSLPICCCLIFDLW